MHLFKSSNIFSNVSVMKMVKVMKVGNISQRALMRTALTILGIILILTSLGYKAYNSRILSFYLAPKVSVAVIRTADMPVSIAMPARYIKLDITPAYINSDGVWETSKDTASFLMQSSVPGKKGNTVIYGHNKASLMGNIRNAMIGDKIFLKSTNGTVRTYVVKNKLTVSQSTVSVVEHTPTETLTLFTCTGFADMQRFVVQAYPIR